MLLLKLMGLMNIQCYAIFKMGSSYCRRFTDFNAVAWEAFKQQSGGVLPDDRKSLSKLFGQTIVGGFCVWFLPFALANIILL